MGILTNSVLTVMKTNWESVKRVYPKDTELAHTDFEEYRRNCEYQYGYEDGIRALISALGINPQELPQNAKEALLDW